jgi:chromosome segregation ATPase
MTTTMTPREQLISADADVKSTKKEVTRGERAERDAQKLADDTRGLAAAAERDLKNAEARYRVLFAAAEETKGLRKQRAEIEQELAEIGRADKVSAATHAAIGPLDDAVKAVTPLENATRQARDTTEHAKSRVQEAAEKVTSAGGQAGDTAGTPGRTSRAQKESSSDKQNSLDTIIQELEQDYERLQGLYKQIHDSLNGLQAQATAVQTAATEAADFANNQKAEKERLLKERAGIDAKLKGQPSPTEVDGAETDRDTARRRFEDAPGAERQAQEALKLARETREDAQRRYREALDRRDRAEGLFITDIDITGPNAAGIFTATAVLAEIPPTGYELHWSSNAGTVKPDTGSTVSFNTGKLPPGSYDIEVSLVHP